MTESLTEKFFVKENTKVSLKELPTSYHGDLEKESSKELLEHYKSELFEMQEKFYAWNSKSLLIIFQAMDAAGKDSVIKHVMSGLNPQGCEVYSFKQPSSEELDHDFLWRHYKALPERGRFGIHNRSHYENVLVCRVHPELILKENLPGYERIDKIDRQLWESRFKSINNFEKHLHENGTTVIKFFLNVSRDEQKKRFIERIDDPAKNWKFSAQDIKERQLWDKYMECYEDVFSNTSTSYSPWYVIPADKKWFTRIAVIDIIVNTLKAMPCKYPELSKQETLELKNIKTLLVSS